MKWKILLLALLAVSLLACKWALPKGVGITDGELHACAGKLNCVSSFAQGRKYVAPIPVKSSLTPEQVMAITRTTLLAMPNTDLRREKGNYLWFEFHTQLGFVDDVELLYDPEKHQIYIRSASRLGYYDFQVNHKRYQMIRDKLKEVLL